METKELLFALEKKLNETDKNDVGYEMILVYLLKEYEDKITGLIEQDESGAWFHKAFRCTDVISGKIDHIIHGLLSKTDIFWECLAPKDVIELNKK